MHLDLILTYFASRLSHILISFSTANVLRNKTKNFKELKALTKDDFVLLLEKSIVASYLVLTKNTHTYN